ncbi:hypothetical protein ZWY2020_052853 [Hordeum vulgare]|nr:hypothetical protein ZWY2020_052853 [Hordeum vulgare]
MLSWSPPLPPRRAEEEGDTRSGGGVVFSYGEARHWDERYMEEGGTPYDCYQRYAALRPFVRRFVPPAYRLFMIGCGSAHMQTDVRDMSKFFDESFDCAPVPLAQFNDTQLLSDYNLLEETSLVRELAHRLLGDFGGNFGRNFEGCSGAKLPPSRPPRRRSTGVRLFFLPHGMTRRAQNHSWHDNRNDCIYWTIESKFNSTDIVLTDHQNEYSYLAE